MAVIFDRCERPLIVELAGKLAVKFNPDEQLLKPILLENCQIKKAVTSNDFHLYINELGKIRDVKGNENQIDDWFEATNRDKKREQLAKIADSCLLKVEAIDFDLSDLRRNFAGNQTVYGFVVGHVSSIDAIYTYKSCFNNYCRRLLEISDVGYYCSACRKSYSYFKNRSLLKVCLLFF